jgi:phosphate-selective porin OprO and OprP
MRVRLFAASLAAVGLAGAGPALAQDSVGLDSSGFTWERGPVELNVGGRLHLDTAQYDDDDITDFHDRSDLRRARVEAALRVGERWRFRVDYDFVQVNDGWRNVWGQYEFADNLTVRAGNQIVPFSMEDMASSNSLRLMERSMASALAPGFGLGVNARLRGDNWTLIGGWFDEPFDNDFDNGISQGVGFAGRATYAPIRRNREVLHFGVGAQTRDMDGSTMRIQLRPESGIANRRFLDTSQLRNIDGYDSYNLEAAYMRGPVSVQAEYSTMNVRRPDRADPQFDSGYIQASWVITGEERDYSRSNGVLGGVDLRRGRQAWEVAARYSYADLNSESVSGGREENWSFGGTWYAHENVRVLANYVHARAEPNRNGVNESVDILQARLQLSF